MIELADLNLIGRAQDTLERWKYRQIQDSEDPDGKNSSDSDNPDESISSSSETWRVCSAHVLMRLAMALTILLLLANLASLQRYRLYESIQPETTSEGDEEELQNPDNGDKEGPTSDIDWHRFAYCQYVTNHAYLCNSLMIFESLNRFESKADRLMMYPEKWDIDEANPSPEAQLLLKARDEYNVNLLPIQVQHFAGKNDQTWADSFTKLLAFNQTQYERVLSLDSDATVLQSMDELFLLPHSPVAMPRAYWLDDDILSSQLVLVEPSEFEFNRILEAFETRGAGDFDMEIVNNLYAKNCFILPHRPYNLLTGEFRSKNHSKYIGSKEEEWNPYKILAEAKFLHFSDWPFPKPWLTGSEALREQVQPTCTDTTAGPDCTDQIIWNNLYDDFKQRRQNVCGANYKVRQKRGVVAPSLPGPPSRYEPIF